MRGLNTIMTTKLYYDSSYIQTWETTIKDVIEKEDGIFVTLEETAFYPEGGGQPSDAGTINGITVLDVFMDGEEVIHKIERRPTEVLKVYCELDWNKRFDHMQHHSGQHLLSAVCLQMCGAKTVSFHLGNDFVTIDLDIPSLTDEQLHNIELEANKQIYTNQSIRSYFVTKEEMEKLPLVKMPKVTENIRIVEIEGIEYNACGGTHVSRTGEIGIIKLFKAEKQKGSTRLYFKCGYRALADYHDTLSIVSTLATSFNTGRSNVLDRFQKYEQEKKNLEAQLKATQEKLLRYESNELLARAEGNVITAVYDDKSFTDLKNLADFVLVENEVCFLLVSTLENKVLFTYNGSQDFSCGKLFKEHLASYNGKGGGNDRSAQAAFATTEELLTFFHFLRNLIK